MSACLFCRIAAGEIPATRVHESDNVVAFRDIDPQAPTHILVVPRRHIPSLEALTDEDGEVMGRLLLVARDLAREEGLQEGWRTVINSGPAACQSVDHVHLHLLGGRAFGWPPG